MNPSSRYLGAAECGFIVALVAFGAGEPKLSGILQRSRLVSRIRYRNIAYTTSRSRNSRRWSRTLRDSSRRSE